MHYAPTPLDALYTHFISVQSTLIEVHVECTHRGPCTLHGGHIDALYTDIEMHALYTYHDTIGGIGGIGNIGGIGGIDLDSRHAGGEHVAHAMGGAVATPYAYGTHDQQSTLPHTHVVFRYGNLLGERV